MNANKSPTDLLHLMDSLFDEILYLKEIGLDDIKKIIVLNNQDVQNDEQLFKLLLLKSNYKNQIGEFQNSINYCNEGMQLKDNVKDKKYIIDYYLTISRNHLALGNFQEGIDSANEGMNNIELVTDQRQKKVYKSDIFSSLGILHWMTGDLDSAYNHMIKGLKIIENEGLPDKIISFHINIGIIHSIRSDHEKAVKEYKKAESMLEINKSIHHSATLSINMANSYYHLGEFQKSLELHRKALHNFEKLENNQNIAASYHNIGNVLKSQGEIEEAIQYFEISLEMKRQIGNQQHIAYTLHSLGVTKTSQNKIEEAIHLLREALTIKTEIGNTIDISSTLFHLILISITSEDQQSANDYLSKLENIREDNSESIINLRYEIAKAYFNKEFKEDNNYEKEMEIFENLASQQVKEDALVVFSLVNIVDILIQVFTSTANSHLLIRINETISNILRISKMKRSYPLYIESLILQSRFKLLTLEFNEAKRLIGEALDISKLKSLKIFETQIEDEITKMNSFISNITDSIADKPSNIELIQQLEIIDIVKTKLMKKSGTWGGLLSL